MRNMRRPTASQLWRGFLLILLSTAVLLTLCACGKEDEPKELPDLHGYVSGLDTIGEGDNKIVLHEVDAEQFLQDTNYFLPSKVKQAVMYASENGSERILAVEFIGETQFKEGYEILAEQLGVIKYLENCSGSIDAHEDYCALVLYTCDSSVDAKLWVNQIARSWLYMIQSLD